MTGARIRRTSVRLMAAVALALAASPAAADWWEVARADASFNLPAARRQALETVAADPFGADAVAAAGWWLDQVFNLPDPEEILAVAGPVRDPELGFLLARIEAALDGRPPAGSLATAEIAGPFGVFDSLDLDRGIAPTDGRLPPPDTPFLDPTLPYRVTLRTLDGIIAPPDTLMARGVFVALWDRDLSEALDGWMAVEAGGGYDLSLDGRPLASRRGAGRIDPKVTWYRVRLDAGRHRLRADFASRSRPEIRISLFDDDGMPVELPLSTVPDAGPWAASDATVADPPAAAEALDGVGEEAAVPELLRAAALREIRGDPPGTRRWLERAAGAAPEDPWPKLELAWYWMTAATDDDADAVRRRAREQLRGAADIPLSLLLERGLAVRERRSQDQERFLDTMVDRYGDDVRVLRLWILEAQERGWVREAEDGLARLDRLLPGARQVAELELQVLEGLERWSQRQQLLRALAGTEPLDRGLIDELAESCLVSDAIELVQRLRQRADHPDLDVELVRLLYTAGDLTAAAEQLRTVRDRWGALRALDEMALALAAGDPEAVDRTLDEALERWPSSIELLTLAWRRGRPAFFEPFRLTVDEVRSQAGAAPDGVDAVLLLDQAVERVFEDGSSLYYYHGISKALTPVGAVQARQLQQLPDSYRLKVRIHKADGSVVVPPELGNDNGVLEISGVEPGDVVEEEYVARVGATGASRRGHVPPYVYRFADSERAFGLSEYLLLVPPELDLLVEGNVEGLERQEWEENGLRAIRWRAESVPPVPDERFAPPVSELLPWVSYAFGVSWQDVGDALRDRLLPLLVATPDLRQWSAPLLDAPTPEHALERLVAAVVDEVEPGRGLLDFATSAGSSLSRRRGNRLGIVAAALLDAGWRVDLVMARTRPFAGTHLLVPTFDTFILPLLRVERDGRQLWIDLEEEQRGVDRIEPILQGSDGLVVPLSEAKEEVRIITELPTFPNPDLEEVVRAAAVVEANGDARLTITLPIRGPQATRVVEQIRAVPTDRVPMVYQQMAANFVPAASGVEGRITEMDGGIELELAMQAPGVCQPDGDTLVCRGLVFGKPIVPVLASLPTRRYPLIMPVPVLQRVELVIDLPEGWTIDHPPRRVETQWGSVVETVNQIDGPYRSVLRLEIPAQTVAPDDYPEFARFCHAADELSSRPPVMIRKRASSGPSRQ
jgi:hypothetical protein